MTNPNSTESNSSRTISRDEKIELSFVIPVFNEESVFGELEQRLRNTMDGATFPCETILVDDGSSDRTAELIEAACERDSRFRGVILSRNFGHQRAVSAGLDHATGKTVGVLDGDLQDPPDLLLDFHRKMREGYDVVYAVRKNRKEGPVKRFCYWAFYRLLRQLATIDIPLDSGDFCLMSRRVVDRIRQLPERHRFVRGLRSWVGFKQVAIEYDRSERMAGESKYTISKLLLLALDGLFTFSETPLRLATFVGASVASLAFMFGAYTVVWRLFNPSFAVPGFATLACGMFFLGGIQLLCLGILGEYVARVHNEVKARPIYIVDRIVQRPSDRQIAGMSETERETAEEEALERDLRTLLPSLGMSDVGPTQVPLP
jgi:dolichol-phosphate mannosyltransferase